MSATPLPTKLVFLYELRELPLEEKVRFLGWYMIRYLGVNTAELTARSVTEYDESTAYLVVKHHYPPKSPKPAATLVDVNLLLESLKPSDLQIGSWINVFGYVRRSKRDKATSGESGRKKSTTVSSRMIVQATMIRSAGTVNIGEYERVVTECQGARRRTVAGT